jgi:hypothetical protein
MSRSPSHSSRLKRHRLVSAGLAFILLLVSFETVAGAKGKRAPFQAPGEPVSVQTGIVAAPEALSAPEALVAGWINAVTQAEVYQWTAYLSGVTPVMIGGQAFTLLTRNTYKPVYLSKAEQYAYEFMSAQGLSVSYFDWYNAREDISGRNVVGTISGSVRPNEIVLITAHLDDMPEGNRAPGADDNASGSVGVMEAAARLGGHRFERSVRFVFFTGEEDGLLGSEAYARYCDARNENIVAVYNMDMIGWDANRDGEVLLLTRVKSNAGYASDAAIANTFIQVVNTYGLNGALDPYIDASSDDGVDSWSFWHAGYPSITAIEDFGDQEENPYYHTVNDTLQTLNLSYFTSLVKASVGTAATLAMPIEVVMGEKIYLPLIRK